MEAVGHPSPRRPQSFHPPLPLRCQTIHQLPHRRRLRCILRRRQLPRLQRHPQHHQVRRHSIRFVVRHDLPHLAVQVEVGHIAAPWA